GHAADQPADRRAAHPRLFVEGAVVEDALDLAALLARVPDQREFLTLEELRESSRRLVAEFPGVARLETVGASAEGRPIELLTIGQGPTPALFLGVPHPTAPTGTLTLELLCRLLSHAAALRARPAPPGYATQVATPHGP